MSATQLKSLCKEFGLTPSTTDLIGYLTRRIHHCLPEPTNEEVKAILELRTVVVENPLANLISGDQMDQVFGKDVEKVVEDSNS